MPSVLFVFIGVHSWPIQFSVTFPVSFCNWPCFDVRANAGRERRKRENSASRRSLVAPGWPGRPGCYSRVGQTATRWRPASGGTTLSERFSRHVDRIAGVTFSGSDVGRRQERGAIFCGRQSPRRLPGVSPTSSGSGRPVHAMPRTQYSWTFRFQGRLFRLSSAGGVRENPYS